MGDFPRHIRSLVFELDGFSGFVDVGKKTIMTDKKVWISGNYGLVVGIIYALLYGVLSYFSVYAQDDYFFGHIYGDYLFRNGVFPGLEPWLDYVAHAFTYANGRLPDKAMPLVMLIPSGIYAVMNVFAVFLILTNGAQCYHRADAAGVFISWQCQP